MINILILIPVWKRPAILEICFAGLQRLKKYNPGAYKVDALAIVSEEEAEGLCKRYKIPYTFFENEPLGRKKNFGLSEALKNNKWDYLMELNSDDVIWSELLDEYHQAIEANEPYIGLKNFCSLDSPTLQMRQHLTDTVYGIGRMYRRDVIENGGRVTGIMMKESCYINDGYMNTGLKKGEIYDLRPETATELIRCDFAQKLTGEIKLWDDNASAGMDNFSHKRLTSSGYRCHQIMTPFPMAVDIKSDVNIWKYNPEAGQPYQWDDFKKGLSKKEIDLIECLKQN